MRPSFVCGRGAAMRDSRHASVPGRFGPSEWCGCVGHGSSRPVWGCVLCQAGPLRLPDNCFLPFDHQAHVWRALIVVVAGKTMRDTQVHAHAFRAATTVDARHASELRKSASSGSSTTRDDPSAGSSRSQRRCPVPPICTTAFHLRHDEGLRLIVCLLREHTREGQPTSESEPPTIRSAEPLAPRRRSVCRRIRVGQLRKVSPHRSRKWPLASAGDDILRRPAEREKLGVPTIVEAWSLIVVMRGWLGLCASKPRPPNVREGSAQI
jgi:hypothetical protein